MLALSPGVRSASHRGLGLNRARPLLLVVAQNLAKLNPDPEMTARLAQPDRRRGVTILTAIIATTFAIDGATQIVLALTVPTSSSSPTRPQPESSYSAPARSSRSNTSATRKCG